MTKSILFLVAVVCAVGCVDRTSLNDGTREAVASRTILLADSMSRDTVDLGRMRQGEIVRQRLLLENGYREPMVILSVSTSCGCTSAEFDRHPVQPGALSSFLIMMVLIFAVMYFFMIRPQQKRQKELVKFRNALEKGQKIITAGGIYGTINEVKETYVLVEVDSNVAIRVDKNMVMKDPSDLAAQAK